MERYAWALENGVGRLRLQLRRGHALEPEQMDAYVGSLLRVLRHHQRTLTRWVLFNWKSDCEPVMLSDDLIVDVDRRIYYDSAIFLERRFPRLKETYRRGHLDDTATQFDPLSGPSLSSTPRWSAATPKAARSDKSSRTTVALVRPSIWPSWPCDAAGTPVSATQAMVDAVFRAYPQGQRLIRPSVADALVEDFKVGPILAFGPVERPPGCA